MFIERNCTKCHFLPVDAERQPSEAAHPDRHGKITKETVSLDGVSVTRVTFGVGASWSHDLKEYARTESCQLPHVALVLSGTLHVVMDDGSGGRFQGRTTSCFCHQGTTLGQLAMNLAFLSSFLAVTITTERISRGFG